MDIINSLLEWLQGIADKVLDVLPDSPFKDIINNTDIQQYLGYINWFVPVGTILKILTAWLVAVAAYYLVSVILRWIKAID